MSNKTPNDHPEKTASARNVVQIALTSTLAWVLGGALVVGLLTMVVQQADDRRNPSLVCGTNPSLRQTLVTSGSYTASAETVDRPEARTKGLSGRNCLEDNRAMLFIFEYPDTHCFWMKDMNFSIDMIWFNEQKRIVTIASDVKPESYPQAYCPEEAAQYVLEVPSGVASRNMWQKGQQFSF